MALGTISMGSNHTSTCMGYASEISYVHQVQLKKYVPQTITFKSKTVEIFGEQRFNFQLQVSELFHLLYNE
jgi:hypothetical protein